ncbi:MAG: diguanylate cyclase [Dehalococcoidia bacterium]|nr:diguanylate cyclase [Dehalococcoidia bacterium]
MESIKTLLALEQPKLGEGVKASILPRGGAFLIGLVVIILLARFLNPSYPIAPVAGVLSAAVILQVGAYLLLRQERLLIPLSWSILVTDVLVIALVIYFTGGIESIFLWTYLALVIAWAYIAGLRGSIATGALSLVSLWLLVGLDSGGILPHHQLLPLATRLYRDPSVMGPILAIDSLAIPLMIWLGAHLPSIRQRENLEGGYLSGVQAFVDAVEAKDPHTRGHSERVSRYAVLIAQELGLERKEVKLIRDAGLVHDVGKMFLPEEVLTQRGALEPAQQAAMMSHPMLSYEVLKRSGHSPELLHPVRHHHEWYGGGGYPDGLSGESIPLAARILAVADAFEAMTAGRYYKARMSIEQAAEEISKGKGTQFDPRVVDAFIRRMKRGEVPPPRPMEPIPTEMEAIKVPLARHQLPWTLGMMTMSQYKASTILFRLGQEVRSVLDLGAVLTKVLSLLKETQGYNNCAIFLKEETGDLVMQAAIGYRIHQKGDRVAKGEGIIGWVSEYDVVRLIPDVTVDQSYLESSSFKWGAMLAAPLSTEGKVVGVLVIENEIVEAFTSDDAHLLEVIGPYIAAVIEVALLHQQTKTAALYDSLTGVHNHRYFYERLEQELMRSHRHGHPLTVAIIDVDDLKKVNDLKGHLAGDQALRRMGHTLKENVRASDIVARYGGDEFAIIMPETEKEEAEKVIRRLMILLDATTVQYNAETFAMPTRSYGLATFPWDGDNPTELFAVADTLLYQAKAKRA